MKIRALTVSRFRGWKETRKICLDSPITAIIGENGCGKSSLLNAIEWCLYGNLVTNRGGSGIDERQDWEPQTRANDGDNGPTFVQIEFGLDCRIAEIKRVLDGEKGRRDGTLTVRDTDGKVFVDGDAESELSKIGLPDWDMYRRAYCFHQEAARQRVVTTRERSALLSNLMGLGDYLSLRETIRDINSRSLVNQLDDTRTKLNEAVTRLLNTRRTRLAEIEHEANELNLLDGDLNEANLELIKTRIKERAEGIVEELGLAYDLQERIEVIGFVEWARQFPIEARINPPALAPLPNYRTSAANLDNAITRFEASSQTLVEAENNLQAECDNGGGEDQRIIAAAQAQQRVDAQRTARRIADSALALLKDALSAMNERNQSDSCPVCNTEVENLDGRLREKIERGSSIGLETIDAALQDAEEELAQAVTRRDEWQALFTAAENARRLKTEKIEVLKDMIEAPDDNENQNIPAMARTKAEMWQERIESLEGLLNERDQKLTLHQNDLGRLIIIENWLRASERADAEFDPTDSPQWQEYDDAKTELAGFASDLDFVDALLRELQGIESESRAEKLNVSLAKYFSLIVGDVRQISVRVHITPQQISYRLLDDNNVSPIPILNQASINALSIAMLFAQAEAQANNYNWDLVALDDPVQSLDRAAQQGLVDAIQEFSKYCSVLVATVSGEFSERVQSYLTSPHNIIKLGGWSEGKGATILESSKI